MKYHTILFDLDGTLLNTLEDLTDAVNYVMDAYDFPEHSIEDVRCFVGNGIRVLMQAGDSGGGRNPQFDEAFELFKRYYLAHNKVKTRPYDGIMELLGELKKTRRAYGHCVQQESAHVEALCEEEFQGLISVAVGDGEGRARKPAPDGPMEAIRRLGLSGTEGVLYVGDSEWMPRRRKTRVWDVFWLPGAFGPDRRRRLIPPFLLSTGPRSCWSSCETKAKSA